MTETTRRLLDEILGLSLEDRAILLDELAKRTTDADEYDPAWLADMAARARRVLAGEREGCTLEELDARIDAQLRGR